MMKQFHAYERVENKMNTTNIQNITITGLFGTRTISIDFNREVNIFIGENGLGKTTIMNCVYYLLSKNYIELLNIDFVSISIKIKGDKEYSILKADFAEYCSRSKNTSRYYTLDKEYIDDLIDRHIYRQNEIDDLSIERLSDYISDRFDIPRSTSYNIVYNRLNNPRYEYRRNRERGDRNKVVELNDAIDRLIDEKIEYFTTYRRIENDFSNIISRDRGKSEKERLIKFGMADVQNQINNNLNSIKTISIENFNRMTGILLKEYSTDKNTSIITNKNNSKIDRNILKVILDRLGNEIEDKQKKRILDLYDSNRLYSQSYGYLLNLIKKLIESYNDQKIYDDRIKNFVASCNKYLNGKHFVYNPSELKLTIELEDDNLYTPFSNHILPLSNLSSGEKQIVSLFSKLYLDDDKKCILIIDEPELSLSMHWQKMLIPDIMRSNNCKLLLTVTHSPFIFDNEFDIYAKEMRDCIDIYEEK